MTLKSLTLTNFRQFESLTLAFEKPWSAIIAPNASGKSTILEALYMLSNGESPWEQNHNHIVKLHPEATSEDPAHVKLANCTSRIEAVLTTDDDEHSIALSFSTNNGTTTKQYVVDGKSTTRPRFLSHLHTVLFSPDLIDLLMFEPAQRRT